MKVFLVITDSGQIYGFTSETVRDEWLREVYKQAKILTKGSLDTSYDEFWGDLIFEEVEIIDKE